MPCCLSRCLNAVEELLTQDCGTHGTSSFHCRRSGLAVSPDRKKLLFIADQQSDKQCSTSPRQIGSLTAKTTMAKRKRVEIATNDQAGQDQPRKAVKAAAVTSELPENDPGAVTIQIVTGSYQSVLHGFTVTLPAEPPSDEKALKKDAPSTLRFADTFLFQAHTSAIRTLALSPPTNTDSSQPQTAILATGGSDERINLYSISMAPPMVSERYPSISTLAGNKILENPKNREIGTLLHHSSSITTLYFPSKSKLLSAAEDNTISVTRVRDWNVVSTVKAPQPKAQGRPSGDTAPLGSVPCGINDFAVHPSMKLMISVGRGERCMRLWNLMTGKKAGVLNFDRELLQSVKENKRSTGEGRAIVWDNAGEEFTIAFEWGVVVFGVVCFTSSHVGTDLELTLRHRIQFPDAKLFHLRQPKFKK